jgi:hypothetical protein
MKSLIEITMYPGLEYSRTAKVGNKLVAVGLGMKAMHSFIAKPAWSGLRVDRSPSIYEWRHRRDRCQSVKKK